MNRCPRLEPASRSNNDRSARRASFLRVTICVLTVTPFLGGCPDWFTSNPSKLFSKTSKCPAEALSPQILACDIVEIRTTALEKADRLSVTLPGDGTITIQQTGIVRLNAHSLIWRGKLNGPGFSNATFSVVNDAVVGTVVTADGRMYRLRRAPQGDRIFERLESKAYRVRDNALKPPKDPKPAPKKLKPPTGLRKISTFPAVRRRLDCATNDRRMDRLRETARRPNVMLEQLEAKRYRVADTSPEAQFRALRRVSTACGAQPPTCGTDSPDRIDVMVVYTPAALNEAGGEDEMAAWINKAEDETNVSYSNSGISQRISVLRGWIKKVEYVEQDLSSDLDALMGRCDGKMDEVHDWRNAAGADIVVLITHIASFGSGGYAYTLQPSEVGSQLFERKAFAVVQQEHFSAPAYVFAHELGHLMGAQHDEESSPDRRGAFDFSHGHVGSTPTSPCTNKWMTIMSEASCCIPIGYWSAAKTSPDTCGDPLGNAAAEDNATTLNKTASMVANFRCSSQTPGNVQ